MSPPVGTIATTCQPSADFSESLEASEAGSYEEALTLMNSGMAGTLPRKPGDPTVAVPALCHRAYRCG